MCSYLPNLFTVILGVGEVFVPLTQKSKFLVLSQQVSVFLGSIYGCLKQLVFKCFSLSNGKKNTAIPNPLAKFCFTRGYPNFHRIVLLKKISVLYKCNPKWYFQLKIVITQISYHWLCCLWYQYQD